MGSRIAPILPVKDLDAALAHYRMLGFRARGWHGGGYGFVFFDGVELHLGVPSESDGRALGVANAYRFVDDADAVAAQWLAAGGDVRLPQDTEWGMHEGVLVDLDGNVIRFGSTLDTD